MEVYHINSFESHLSCSISKKRKDLSADESIKFSDLVHNQVQHG